MSKVLLIGYGNLCRRDDGVAYHVLRQLRERLGYPTPTWEADEEELSEELALMCVHQLGPEMAETLSRVDVVVFIDAHIADTDWEPVHWEEITPALRPSLVSHHMKPGTLLALCAALYGHVPRGYSLSILGVDFDFGQELSPTTAGLVEEAVDSLIKLLQATGSVANSERG